MAAQSEGVSVTPTSVFMPRLGETVTEGTVTRWLKRVGDRVDAGEPLLSVSTDKVDTEVTSPASGTLLEIKVHEEQTVEVGVELALIGAVLTRASVKAAPTVESTQPVSGSSGAERPRPRATPFVRRLAREHGVDLTTVTGSGDRGRIRKSDVLATANGRSASVTALAPALPSAASAPNAAPAAAVASPTEDVKRAARRRVEPMTRTRQIIATRMLESLQTSAQLTTVVEVDLTRVARLRELAKKDFEAREGVKLTFLPFFAVAALEALKAHPIINASVDGAAKTITYHEAQHLGVAVDTRRGLVVPVIRDAGDLNVAGIARKLSELADRARANAVSPDELGGGTFTITNTGSRGALFDTPIINQPQSAILGTGAVVKRAAVITDPELGEVIVPRSIVHLALSYDHRIIDGADAARFLVSIKERLETGRFEHDLGMA